VLGVVMAYSASAVYAGQKYHDAAYFLERDIVYALLGAFGMWFAAKTDFHVWRRWAYPMVLGAILLLVAVLFLGTRINGATRWFRMGPLSFQAAELAKFALVSWLAYSLAKKSEKVQIFTVGFLPHLFVAGLMGVLLLRQPDFGTAVILCMVCLLMLLVAGTK